MHSPKWIHQVLRDRGIPSPGYPAIEAALAGLSVEQEASFTVALNRIAAASESMGEIELVRALLISTAKPLPDTDQAKPEQETVVKQEPSRGEKLIVNHHDMETKPTRRLAATRRNRHIYGGKAALTFETDSLRTGDEEGTPTPTLCIDMASASAPKEYDWEHKITFQLTLREQIPFTAFLMGYAGAQIKFDHHGQNRDKSLHLEDQGDKLFAKLIQGRRSIAVPIVPADMGGIVDLALEVVRGSHPGLTDATVLATLRRVGAMLNRSAVEACS